MHVEDIARVCHEANRALQGIFQDPANPVSPSWQDASKELRLSAIHGVVAAQEGATPRELHEEWCETKQAQGWTYGPVKDDVSKTHPCLVDFDELPERERVKDSVFHAIVNALS